MKVQVCKLSFHLFVKEKLAGFANGVKDGIFKNITVFISPPFASDELAHSITDYISRL